MPFTTNAQLEAAIANWLARDDLTAYIPDFVRLFECAAARRLKVRLQETTTTLIPSSGVATLPSDFLGERRVTWASSPVHDLDYVAPTIYASYIQTGSGIPTIYTVEGSNLRVAPSSDSDLTVTYFQRSLNLANTLNWLYTYHFDVYLFGSLCEANAFNKDVDPAGLWKARRDEGFDEIERSNFRERSNMVIRSNGPTP